MDSMIPLDEVRAIHKQTPSDRYLPQNLCKIFQQVTSLAEENNTCFIGLESQGTVKDKEGQPETKGDCKLCFAAREHYGEPIV